MQKKLIALAVAGLVSGAAFAQSNVTISGKVAGDVTFLGSTGTSGAADNKTHQVNNNNSNIFFSGKEALGNGMEAFFNVGMAITLANGGAVTNNQNQILGLKGGFGTVFVGAHDNPLKVMGRGTDLFADQSTGDARYLTGRGAVEARANDVIAYISPSFSGVSVVVAHTNNPLGGVASDGAATNAVAATMNGTTGVITAGSAATAWDSTAMNIIKVAYSGGPVTAALGWHKIDTGSLNTTVGDEKAVRLTGTYTAGGLKVAASWQKVDNAYDTTADTRVWGLGAAYTMGATTVKGQYYKLTNKTTASSDAKMLALGADYALGKRTTAQLAYSKVTNDTAASYGVNAVVAGSDAYSLSAAGQDPSRVSIGLRHTF